MQGASLFREFIPCDGRKRISVQENGLEHTLSDTITVLNSYQERQTVISPYPNNLEWILHSCLLQWLPEPSIQLCNDLTITRPCLLADTFDPTITGEEPIHETHRTLVLHVRDSNQTGAFESPFLIKWFYWFDKTTYCLVQFWCSCSNKAWTT